MLAQLVLCVENHIIRPEQDKGTFMLAIMLEALQLWQSAHTSLHGLGDLVVFAAFKDFGSAAEACAQPNHDLILAPRPLREALATFATLGSEIVGTELLQAFKAISSSACECAGSACGGIGMSHVPTEGLKTQLEEVSFPVSSSCLLPGSAAVLFTISSSNVSSDSAAFEISALASSAWFEKQSKSGIRINVEMLCPSIMAVSVLWHISGTLPARDTVTSCDGSFSSNLA
jgi:hypothetical protein